MERPEESPPFRTYFEAWRSEFQQTFRDLGLKGDAEDAAGRCTRDQGLRNAFTDAFKVLPRLQESWRVAILSNSDHSYLLEVIERQGWSFELVVSSESARAYKPDPRIFECFCRQASVTPSETLFVGDSLYDDVHGAKQCGFRTAWLRRDDESSGMTPPSEDQEMLFAGLRGRFASGTGRHPAGARGSGPGREVREMAASQRPQVKLDEEGLVPAICQDAATGQVLMVAHMNPEALKRTLEGGQMVFYSRSREELWHKGATLRQLPPHAVSPGGLRRRRAALPGPGRWPSLPHRGAQLLLYASFPGAGARPIASGAWSAAGAFPGHQPAAA